MVAKLKLQRPQILHIYAVDSIIIIIIIIIIYHFTNIAAAHN